MPVKTQGTLLDIVGTGGDGACTINSSTCSAILAAACGAKVTKCGNRSVSSACGAADVLEALGLDLELDLDDVTKCIDDVGLGFCSRRRTTRPCASWRRCGKRLG